MSHRLLKCRLAGYWVLGINQGYRGSLSSPMAWRAREVSSTESAATVNSLHGGGIGSRAGRARVHCGRIGRCVVIGWPGVVPGFFAENTEISVANLVPEGLNLTPVHLSTVPV